MYLVRAVILLLEPSDDQLTHSVLLKMPMFSSRCQEHVNYGTFLYSPQLVCCVYLSATVVYLLRMFPLILVPCVNPSLLLRFTFMGIIDFKRMFGSITLYCVHRNQRTNWNLVTSCLTEQAEIFLWQVIYLRQNVMYCLCDHS